VKVTVHQIEEIDRIADSAESAVSDLRDLIADYPELSRGERDDCGDSIYNALVELASVGEHAAALVVKLDGGS
jgi:hypothetical protein